MLYKNVIIRASKDIMYHGTTSQNLRAILKKGLVYDKNKRVWGEDKSENLESYPGIYFSSALRKADTAAGDATRKYGGERLIVVAQIETQTPQVVIDEDGLQVSLKRTIPFHHELVVLEQALNPDQVNWDKSWEEFKKIIKEDIDELPERIDVLKEEFIDLIEIYLKYSVFNLLDKGALSRDAISSEKNKVQKFENKYDFKEVREEYREKFDKFIRKINFIANKIHEGPLGKSIRITESVNFKGANKIVVIVTFIQDFNNKDYRLKVHYNKSDKALDKLKSDAKEMIGKEVEIEYK